MRISKLRDELHRLEKANQALTPQIVLEAARVDDSPLHNTFDWDDETASEKYRLMQARMLLTAVKVEIKGNKLAAFINVNVMVENIPTRVYVSTQKALTNANINRQIIIQAAQELEYWKQKYNTFKELAGIINTEKLDKIKNG